MTYCCWALGLSGICIFPISSIWIRLENTCSGTSIIKRSEKNKNYSLNGHWILLIITFWDERDRNAQTTAHQERGTLRLSPATVVHDFDHQKQCRYFNKTAQNVVSIPVSHYWSWAHRKAVIYERVDHPEYNNNNNNNNNTWYTNIWNPIIVLIN